MSKHPTDTDVIGTPPPKKSETADLPMFAEAPMGAPAPAFRAMVMRGVGEQTRRQAREKVEPHLRALRGIIWKYLKSAGPRTRLQLHQELEIKENTVNGRVAELIELKAIRVSRAIIDGKVSDRGMLEAVDPPDSEAP